MPKLQPPQGSQHSLTNGESKEALINDFLSLIGQAASHGGCQHLSRLARTNEDLKKELTEKSVAYRHNLKALNEKEAETAEKELVLSGLKKQKATAEGDLQKMEQERDQYRQQSDKTSKVLQSMSEANKDLQRKIDSLEQDLKNGKERVEEVLKLQESLQQELRDKHEVEEELDRLRSLSAIMNEYDGTAKERFQSKLERIFRLAYKFAEDFLLQDIDMESITPDDWNELTARRSIDGSGLPLPMSNSAAAKQMRFAVGLYALAYALTRHVFQPIYLSEDQDEVGRLLVKISSVNPDQELHVRSALLMALGDEQYGQARAKKAAQETFANIKVFVSESAMSECETRVYQICAEALTAWGSIQHLTELVFANFKHTMTATEGERLKLPELPLKAQTVKGGTSKKGDGSTKGGPSKSGNIQSGSAQNQTRAPSDPSSHSLEETIFYIWPQFSTAEDPLYPGKYLTGVDVGPARSEYRREETKRRDNRRTNNRRNSDASTTISTTKRNGTSSSFLTPGNGESPSKV